jgi:hypothetical protein
MVVAVQGAPAPAVSARPLAAAARQAAFPDGTHASYKFAHLKASDFSTPTPTLPQRRNLIDELSVVCRGENHPLQ